MNIAKNMEAIFFVAIVLASGTGFATAKSTAVRTAPSVTATVATAATATAALQGPMQVVTVSAKRLTAAEKAALPQ